MWILMPESPPVKEQVAGVIAPATTSHVTSKTSLETISSCLTDLDGRRAQGDELAVRMREALQKGTLGISALSPRVTTGKEQWQEWHHDFFHNQMQDFIQDDMSSCMRSADQMNTDLEVITLREASQTALEVRPNRALTFR